MRKLITRATTVLAAFAMVVTTAVPSFAAEEKDYKRAKISAVEMSAIESLFDAEYYAKENPDVVKEFGEKAEDLFKHFLQYGIWETRQPNEKFNVNAYASAYADLTEAFEKGDAARTVVDLYRHYAEYGKKEGRVTSIVECLKKGRDVLYYGAYDDETPGSEYEHVVATNTKAAPALKSFADYYFSTMLRMYAKLVAYFEDYRSVTEGSGNAFDAAKSAAEAIDSWIINITPCLSLTYADFVNNPALASALHGYMPFSDEIYAIAYYRTGVIDTAMDIADEFEEWAFGLNMELMSNLISCVDNREFEETNAIIDFCLPYVNAEEPIPYVDLYNIINENMGEFYDLAWEYIEEIKGWDVGPQP